jgi:flavin reductase (DIM6/NTAB) family NADH-FMN oxidoreductase RutF
MRRFASSVCVVTTADAGGLHGITVTSLASVSVDPPTLLVCIRHDSPCAAAIRESETFCVNLLSDGAKGTAHLFSGATGARRQVRFARVEWRQGHTGCPILPGSVIAFECRVERTMRVATHNIFFAGVIGVHNGCGSPLLYADRAYRRLADGEQER